MSSIQTFLERIANNYSPQKSTSGGCGNFFLHSRKRHRHKTSVPAGNLIRSEIAKRCCEMPRITVSRSLLAKRLVARYRRAKHLRRNPTPGRHPMKSEQA